MSMHTGTKAGIGEAAPKYFESRVRRQEDPRLLTGKGCYIDDVRLPDMLHAAFVRSAYAHARILGVDTSAALAMEGVVAVYTAADMRALLTSLRLPIGFPEGQLPDHVMPYVLTPEEAVHVGEAIAMVVAVSRHIAEDAVDAILVDYDPLPAVVDAREVLQQDAPPSRLETGTNTYKPLKIGYGDCDPVFAGAAHVFRQELSTHRGVASSMEGRGVVARAEPATGEMTVWSSTQMSHELAHTVAQMLGMDESRVRVIAPDVGGAFGAKYLVYPEEIAVPAAAAQLGRPVKWIEDRREHFLAAIQERDQFWSLEIAFDADAHILGIRGRLVHDQGAYAPHSYNVPYNAATSLMGPYIVPAYNLEIILAQTNKVPVIPVRGAGYPQGNFAMERLMDCAARELKLDRAEIRRRNLISAAAMPYDTPLKNRAGTAIVYDSGDYLLTQERGLAEAAYADFPVRQSAARHEGRYIGMGIAQAVKGTGRGPFESARVRVATNGRVEVFTGALEMGQGIKTSLAQICADELGVSMNMVDVIAGDTSHIPYGLGGFASRQAITAGTSTLLAAREVRQKAITVASHMLGVAEQALHVRDGLVCLKEETSGNAGGGGAARSVPLGRIAAQLRGMPGYSFPPGVTVGLEATNMFRIDALAYANAFHVCEVEVDIDTGAVKILRYIAIQDCGKLINPQIAEGQIHGSVAHGIGNALFEWMGYDDDGQPLTTTFADYLLPAATDVPHIEIVWLETPSPINPLGIKGAAEAGIVCVGSVLASAIEDALASFNVRIADLPVKPMRLLELIEAGRPAEATAQPAAVLS
ncbi:xanthine dehydrogenase family protein molybdopterin-binding subunit [Oxalobacteraceae bacterium CAVE-383]|nr:xanthine dehydrogenase family protein molybdopterin-binding subunit [Oxalobacteraceae bacterium CAVE-383]